MQPLKISLIIEKRVDKKNKEVKYEVFHIITAKDALGVEFYPKQSVGTTSVKLLEAEVVEFEHQINYRKQVLREIESLKTRKAQHTNYEDAVKDYIKNNK